MNENTPKKKKSVIGRIILGILAAFGILFVILLLIPTEDEEEGGKRSQENVSVQDEDERGEESEEKETKEEINPEVEKEAEEERTESTEAESGNAGNGSSGKHDVEPVSVGTDAKSATIMIYMNGSDLESEIGEATSDISEMLDSGIGDNVSVIIQTMGTRKWQDYGISSKRSQIYRANRGELELIKDDLGQLDCTSSKTLSDFIRFGKENYPADRYIFIFWDHGGGPVYGFGLDEWQDASASLTLDEMSKAFKENSDIHFDIIGMDCCIMANVETCYILSPFCKYSVLSEDFESSLGWYYTDWMKKIEKDPGISTPLLGKKIIDDMISSNEEDEVNGYSSTMILVNERAVPDLLDKWTAFAYDHSDELLGINYSKLHKARGRGLFSDLIGSWGSDMSNVTLEDFYVSDMMSIIESVGDEGDSDDKLKSALKACVAYFGHTSDTNELTGLAVSLPYGDPEFYESLSKVYSRCGFDKEYIKWLENFVNAEGRDNYNDYSSFENSWGGWCSYGGSCFSYVSGSGSGGNDQGSCDDSDSEYCGNDTGCYGDSCGYSDDTEYPDDWTYDYEEDVWFMVQNGTLYLYDEKSDLTCYYDESTDEVYYYDENNDDWCLVED